MWQEILHKSTLSFLCNNYKVNIYIKQVADSMVDGWWTKQWIYNVVFFFGFSVDFSLPHNNLHKFMPSLDLVSFILLLLWSKVRESFISFFK